MKSQRSNTRSRSQGAQPQRSPSIGAQAKQATGRYVQSASVAYNMSSSRNGPQISRHREKERIATVSGSASFAVVGNFALNPGIAESFPWLSGVAQRFERYNFDSLTVRYKNLKGTDTDGNIIISYDPDTLDGAPATAVAQTQSTAYIDGAPWRIFELKVPCSKEKKFVRAGPVVTSDLKTYDAGRIWVTAEGCADSTAHGYLEVEYSVSLHEKQSASAGASVTAPAVNQWNLPANQASGAGSIIQLTEAVQVQATDPPTNSSGVITLVSAGWYKVTGHIEANNTTTCEIRVDGVTMTIPCYLANGNSASGTATRYVYSDGTTTVELYGAVGTYIADCCQIEVECLSC